jgi:hypothetical protein
LFPETISRQRGRVARVALTLLLPSFLWACQFDPLALTGASAQTGAQLKTHDGSADGFTLDYPEGWNVTPKGSDGNLVNYLVQLTATYEPTLILSVQETPKIPNLDSEGSCNVMLTVMEQQRYTPKNREFMAFAGAPGCELRGTSSSGVVQVQNYLSGAGFTILTAYSATTSHDQRIKDDLRFIARSFRSLR